MAVTAPRLRVQRSSTSKYDRVLVAAGMAEALMSIGVRAVVVAGWMVEDVAAHVFARTLYAALLNGSRLADAVADARRLAYELGGATWGGYQCYGDPDWRLQTRVANEQIPPPAYNQVASSRALVLLLKSIETRLRFDGADRVHELKTVRMLDKEYASRWAASGAVAEVFASVYAATGDLDSAVAWYDRAIAAPDGRASMRAVEQLGNLKVRGAWQTFEIESSSPSVSAGDETVVPRRKRSAAVVSSQADRSVAATRARQQVDEAPSLRSARSSIKDAMTLLEKLLALQSTIERESIYGSACKRLALIEAAARRPAEERRAIEAMKLHYRRAEVMARAPGIGSILPSPELPCSGLGLERGTARMERPRPGHRRGSAREPRSQEPRRPGLLERGRPNGVGTLYSARGRQAREHTEITREGLSGSLQTGECAMDLVFGV